MNNALHENTSMTTEEPAYLNGLNPEQRLAVETLTGPVLVLAGAGTGKTRALTARLAHLLATHTASPGQILAVTFTNKAAEEMRHRVSALMGGMDVAGWWIGTYHALAARMLRRHAELVGLTSNYTIIDDDDQLRLLKQIFELQAVDSKTINPKIILMLIDGWKNKGLWPEELTDAHQPNEKIPLPWPTIKALYQAYQDRLRALNACDFGDLLLHLVRLFRNPENGVLAQYHVRFKYILVDEYQDTNTVQYQWLRLLAQQNHNICCVGDDDQSIYAWRGAEVKNILNFDKDFADAKIIRLEQNYRSTTAILNAANGLIARNRDRMGKNLWSGLGTGEKVAICVAVDQNDEARQIIEQIEQLYIKKTDLDQVAILVRAGSQMRAFEERFNHVGLAYRVVGGPRFYERMEIRDALAYLRLVAQPNDDLAFERIINTPKRGLGDKTLQDLHQAARALRAPLLYTVEQVIHTDQLKPAVRKTLHGFADDIARWRSAMDTLAPHDFAAQVLEESGYIALWRNDKSIEAAGRLDNLKELITAINGFTTMGAFLEHVSLVMETQQKRNVPSATLMTLHAAKGLEFDHVFLPGWEEDLFPSKRSMNETGLVGLEEERRLAYVGLTRARVKATIFYAVRRLLYGEYNDAVPSRFIDEIPKEWVDDQRINTQQKWNVGVSAAPQWTRSWGGGQNIQRLQRASTKVIDSTAITLPSTSAFTVGQRVFSDKFGYGRVTAIQEDKLDIQFEKSGQKKLMDSFVRPAEQA
jgi:DNA helicase-2/ATP-dependent DNA helicase PcrA